MSSKRILPFALLMSGALSAQYTATVKTTVTKTENADWKKWSDKECVINFPGHWTNEGSMGTGALVIFFAPPDPDGGFRERVLITTMDAKGKTVAELAATLEADAPLGMTSPQKMTSEVTDDAASVELSGTIDGQPVRVKRELSLRGEKAWVLTYIAPPARYDDALYLADAMFMSFAVK